MWMVKTGPYWSRTSQKRKNTPEQVSKRLSLYLRSERGGSSSTSLPFGWTHKDSSKKKSSFLLAGRTDTHPPERLDHIPKIHLKQVAQDRQRKGAWGQFTPAEPRPPDQNEQESDAGDQEEGRYSNQIHWKSKGRTGGSAENSVV